MNSLDTVSIVVLSILLSVLCMIGIQTYKASKMYQSQKSELTKEMQFDNKIKSNIHNLVSTISFGLYKNTNKQKRDNKLQTQQQYKDMTNKYMIYYLLVLALMLLSYFFVSLKTFIITLCLALLGTLVLGLFLPIMTIVIQKDIDYIGSLVLSYESKSIFGSISKLYANNKIVAFIIFVFSVLLPTLKIISILIITLFVQNRYTLKMIQILKAIGKWSMADIFVISILLVYLSMNGNDVTNTTIEIGFYFFFVYVVLSMIVTLLSYKMIKSIV